MAEIAANREREPFRQRVLWPAGFTFGAWWVLNFLTSHLEWFGKGQFYRLAADTLYSLLGFVIIFGGLIVYSLLYLRGASTKEKILWAFTVPLAWILKEIWRVSSFFSLGESFYYALAPGPMGLLVSQLFFLPCCEIFWRWRTGKKGVALRMMTLGPALTLIIFAILVYFMLFWGNAGDTPGSNLFYLYMEGYKLLFVK